MNNEIIVINGVSFTEDFNILCGTCGECNPCLHKCDLVRKKTLIYLYKQLKEKEQELTNIMSSKFKELGRALDAENRYMQALDEIENIVNELHYSTLYFHSGKTHTLADRIQKSCKQILDIINKADFRTDTAPISEDIEPTKPKGLSGESVRAQRKSKTAKEVKGKQSYENTTTSN